MRTDVIDPAARRALVLGGSGALGSAVVEALRARGVSVAFTWLRGEQRASTLASQTGAISLRVDLRDTDALQQALSSLPQPPDLLVHCALHAPLSLEAPLTDWDEAQAVNCRSLLVAIHSCPALRDVVVASALDRAQSLPLPLPLAATQGANAALVMALAQERGASLRANLVALGPIGEGLSSRLPPALLEEYRKYSALGRLGTAAEAARTIVWLALENTYMSGKVLSIGGI